MNIRLSGVWLVGLILFAAVSPLSAGSLISWMEGDVRVERNGSEQTAEIGLEVFDGDRIVTGADSLAIVDLEDRGTLKLKSETSVVLESTTADVSVGLFRGGLFSRFRRGAGGGYQVRTPNTVAAVRGTEFFMAYGKTVDEEPDLWLCVNEGQVEVGLTRSDESVLVNEGEGINILGGARITDPKYFPWTEDLNWNTDPESGSVADSTDLDGAYADLRDFDYD